MRSLLREFVRTVLAEKMLDANAAARTGYALWVHDRSDMKVVVVYSPEKLQAALDPESLPQSADELAEKVQNSIQGMLKLEAPATGECWGAWEVTRSAGEKGSGVGPLLYYVAATLVPSHRIMSDRRAVSSDAERVWQKFQQGAGKTKPLPFDDESDPKNEDPADDCMLHADPNRKYLDYAYEIGDRPNIDVLKRAHEEFSADLGFTLDQMSEQEIESAFQQGADWYFQSRYSS